MSKKTAAMQYENVAPGDVRITLTVYEGRDSTHEDVILKDMARIVVDHAGYLNDTSAYAEVEVANAFRILGLAKPALAPACKPGVRQSMAHGYEKVMLSL